MNQHLHSLAEELGIKNHTHTDDRSLGHAILDHVPGSKNMWIKDGNTNIEWHAPRRYGGEFHSRNATFLGCVVRVANRYLEYVREEKRLEDERRVTSNNGEEKESEET